jgi:hypothetical protein
LTVAPAPACPIPTGKQSGGGYTVGQITLGNCLAILAKHKRLQLSTGQIVWIMGHLKDIPSRQLIRSIEFINGNTDRIADTSASGIVKFIRRCVALGVDNLATLDSRLNHKPEKKPKPMLMPAEVRQRLKSHARRNIDVKGLAARLFPERRRFEQAWAKTFIQTCNAVPDARYISPEQVSVLIGLAEQIGLNLDRFDRGKRGA